MPLTPRQQQDIIKAVTEEKHRGRGGMFGKLGRKYGPLGEMLGMIVDVLTGGRNPRKRDIENAMEILTEEGFRVESPSGPTPPPIIGVQRPRRSQTPSVTTKREKHKEPEVVLPVEEPWPEAGMIQVLPTRVRGAFDLIPEDITGVSPEIETPESSNVYSVQYDYDTGLLYVRFKSPSPVMGYKTMKSICSGNEYRVGIRPHDPGPLYSYGGAGRKIPPEKFAELVGAASKGQWVWENLRVCGSQWQHRVPYTLTTVPEGGVIPRKATRRGLRVRTVPTVGTGRRGGRRSTLPERIR